MARDENIIDWRSTGRRKARRALFAARVDFKCVGYTDESGTYHSCGKTTYSPPKDAPSWFDELWPTERRVLSPQALQADHESKDLQDNDVEDLNWRCSSCHKLADAQTDKGESRIVNDISGLLRYRLPIPVRYARTLSVRYQKCLDLIAAMYVCGGRRDQTV